ncbi:MAG: tol-pal system protein YbgF [bacterium]
MNSFRQTLNANVVIVCAALAAHTFAPAIQAAVPIEESVEDSSRMAQTDRSLNPEPVRRVDRARSLDIPPTIEPSFNSDGSRAVSVEPVAGQGGIDAQTSAGQRTGAASSGQLSELFYQLQVLQQEIQDLRGQVEEQTYLVNRLQRDQKEQYLDLDRRVMAITEKQPAPGPVTSAPESLTPGTSTASLSEREAYTNAFEAMRARDFDASMMGFQRLIETYPNGQYTPNAYYWIGELHLVGNLEPELARQAFAQVINLYPDHQKAPDALYKLGVVYDNLGDRQTALDYLQRVQQQHPNSPAAGLAQKYAAELQR